MDYQHGGYGHLITLVSHFIVFKIHSVLVKMQTLFELIVLYIIIIRMEQTAIIVNL